MRPKAMFVVNSLAGGGAERVFATLLRASTAQARTHDCVAVLLDRDDEAYALPDWLRVHRLDSRGSLARSTTGLNRIVAAERPDIALSFLTRANVALAAAMAPRRRPFIISERVNTTAHLGTGARAFASRAMVRIAYPRAARVIAVSQGVADTLAADFTVRADRIDVIANPVDLDHITELAVAPVADLPPRPYAVAIGRLVDNKNFALAIEAFAASGLPGRLVILGQGPERDALMALGNRLGLGDRLVLPGFAANPYAVLARADFLILSSNAEGFPNALVEALAAGIPAIATDCRSGPAEVLEVRIGADGSPASGSGGLLVPVNDVAAMTEALRRMANAGTRTALAAKGTQRVRAFSVEHAVSRYWAVIDEVLGKRR